MAVRVLALLAVPVLGAAAYVLWRLGSFGALEGAGSAWLALLVAEVAAASAVGALSIATFGYERLRAALALRSSRMTFVAVMVVPLDRRSGGRFRLRRNARGAPRLSLID